MKLLLWRGGRNMTETKLESEANLINETIKKFLIDNYIESTIHPHFSVLIKGEWGCGKTFFIDSILKEKYGEDYRKESVIWLSLYGLSDINQVSQKLYELTHPFLSNKLTKFAFGVAKSAVKVSTGIDINKDGNNDVSFDLSLFDIENDENNIKTKKLLVIDDLERCSIPPEQILGFFSDYILEKELKTIFIGNTDEIGKKNKTETDVKKKDNNKEKSEETKGKSEFEKIKEKVIGIEFTIFPEIENAVNKFVDELDMHILKKEICEICINVATQLKFKNLRVFRQAFYFLKQLLSVFSENDIQNHQWYFKLLILYYFVIYSQKSSGEIRKDDVDDTIEAYYRNQISFINYQKQVKKDVYNFNYAKIPLKTLYADIIFDGLLDKSAIKKDFAEWTSPKEERPAYIRIIQDWIEMSDTEFKQLYKAAMQEFKKGSFYYYAELLSFAYMELVLSNYNLSKKRCSDIEKEILNYAKRHKAEMYPDENFYLMRFFDLEKEEYRESYKRIIDFLKEENSNNTKLCIKKEFSRILLSLPTSLSELKENIRTFNSNSRFYNYAILNEISIRTFYYSLKKLSYAEQREVYNCFCDRYGKAYSNGTLKKEYYLDVEKIKELAELYKKSTKSVLMSPENKQKEFLAQWYEELYEWMKNQIQGES